MYDELLRGGFRSWAKELPPAPKWTAWHYKTFNRPRRKRK